MNSFNSFFIGVRWEDIADIVLNSYILFRLYILFRETNVLRVLMGVTFLWFFQRVAVYMGLIVTSWAIQGITAVAALIIIVVFSNEIRSVLQARSLRSILWGKHRQSVRTPVEIIVESAYEMAQRRIGALMVFPGKDDLTPELQNGIRWSGLVSKEMIMSIFWHDNPVHDGAIVIQGNQVTEVSVILPLSQRKDLPSYYGTRHRAALGVAENSDALVIVISEERGNVSVAKGQNMTVINRKERLFQILQEHAGIIEKRSPAIRKERMEMGIAAVMSFLIITGVWFSFTRGLDTLITLQVPIEYMNRKPDMEIAETSAHNVVLQLSGSAMLVKAVRPEQVQVRLDMKEASVGSNLFRITENNITLPPGITLTRATPQTVQVTLDVPVIREIPVQADWTGKLDSNLILEKVKLSPSKLQVMGGSLTINDISTIYTEKINLYTLKKSGTLTLSPVFNPPTLRAAPGIRDTITAEITIRERQQNAK